MASKSFGDRFIDRDEAKSYIVSLSKECIRTRAFSSKGLEGILLALTDIVLLAGL